MHRFYCPAISGENRALRLTGGEAHHGLHVLRVRRGERVSVLDGRGTECVAEVEGNDREEITLNVLEQRSVPPPACRVTLVQALPKGKTIEWIIQKATELGVSRIVPLLSQRVVVQLEAVEAVEKGRKWQAVAIESIKQCGAAWLPRVEAPVTLGAGSVHPREVFRRFHLEYQRPPQTASVWVGPEGDFTAAEYAAIQSAGGQPITLGPLVLRSETAALYCLSILNYEVQAAVRPI